MQKQTSFKTHQPQKKLQKQKLILEIKLKVNSERIWQYLQRDSNNSTKLRKTRLKSRQKIKNIYMCRKSTKLA